MSSKVAEAPLLSLLEPVHPMNSSRLMLSLLHLAEAGIDRPKNAAGIAGLISVRVLRTLLGALQFRDAKTMLHARRTSLICRGIAERLGWEEDALNIIELAALAHDMGKIGLPDHILKKPGKLSPDEAEHISVQHRVTICLLQACGVNSRVIDMVAHSHGVDKTEGPVDAELGLGARVLSVADAYDSLTTNQAYRPAYDPDEALKILDEQTGKEFDRNVVAALTRWLQSPGADMLLDLDPENLPPQSSAVSTAMFGETNALCYLLNTLHSMECMYEGLIVVDADLMIRVWNSGAERTFATAARHVLGKQWNPDDFSIVSLAGDNGGTALRDTLREGRAVCRRLAFRDPATGDSVRELAIHTVPLIENGDARGAVGLIYDTKQAKRHEGQFRQLQMAATRDALTGVMNRGELESTLQQLHHEYEVSKGHTPYSVIFFDLDHFKAINDRLGHNVGDQVLIEVARLMEDETYSGESVGRYGGEEFVIVCPETEFDAAIEKSERLRRVLINTRIANRTDLRVTASFGVAQVEPGDTVDSVVERADSALYEAKNGGRNRTCSQRRFEQPLGVVSSFDLSKKKVDDWVVCVNLVTNVAADLIVYKLKGFVHDHAVEILECTPKRIVVNCGRAGLFGWGNRPEAQPVKVSIDIQNAPSINSKSGNKRILLATTVEPVTRPMRPAVFQARAHQIIDHLRSYSIADTYHGDE
ncbi:MAG: diguanylate cyclase [Planctomycetaceae bacterium]|nr:diguanylate cyclase [Planctomycetaceae bacterium]